MLTKIVYNQTLRLQLYITQNWIMNLTAKNISTCCLRLRRVARCFLTCINARVPSLGDLVFQPKSFKRGLYRAYYRTFPVLLTIWCSLNTLNRLSFLRCDDLHMLKERRSTTPGPHPSILRQDDKNIRKNTNTIR